MKMPMEHTETKNELGFKVAVIVSRDQAREGAVDELGSMALESLHRRGVFDTSYRIQPPKADALRRLVEKYCSEGVDLVLILGGPGSGQAAHGAQVLKTLSDPGSERVAMGYSLMAAKGHTLLAAVPGSLAGMRRTLESMYPRLFEAWYDLAQAA